MYADSPLGVDIRVSETTLGDRRDEIHRGVRHAATVQVAGQTLEQVVGHARGVARNQHVAPVSQGHRWKKKVVDAIEHSRRANAAHFAELRYTYLRV